MNALGANLASVRSAADTPPSRGSREDDNAAAFGMMFDAIAGDGSPRDKAIAAEPEPDTPPAPSEDTAPASTILAALDAASSATAGSLPTGLEALLGQALPTSTTGSPAEPAAETARRNGLATANGIAAVGLHGRLQVTVLSQETHFAPVKPHPVTLMPVLPAADATAGLIDAAQPGQVSAATLLAGGSDARPSATAMDGASAQGLAPATLPSSAQAAGGPDVAMPAVASSAANAATSALAATASPGGVSAGPSDPAQVPGISQAAATVGAMAAPTRAPAQSPSEERTDTAEAAGSDRPAPSAALQANAVQPVRSGSLETSPDERGERRLETAQTVSAATTVQGAPASSATPALQVPSLQVAEAVLAEVGRLPGAPGLVAQPGLDGPLRILTIQLRPDDLGTVVVRMRLRGDQLEMSLHASREETASLLRSDGAALDDLLRNAGYQPDLVTVTSGRGDGSGLADPARGGAGSSSQGGSNGDPRHANSDHSGRRQPDAREQERAGTSRDRTSDETNSGGSGRLGRYL